jgi:DNA-binding CsgD family transcriptional regulator
MPKKRSGILIPRASLRTPIEVPPADRNFLRLDITERQLEILTWVEKGKSATDIGGILGISHRTVEHHLEKVCHTLGVRTRFQAVLKVRDLGLIGRTGP